MTVIYAEKPSVAISIAKALASGSVKREDGYCIIKYKGADTYITWGFGHMCELKQAIDYDVEYKNWSNLPMPFIPAEYQIKARKDVSKQLKVIKKLFGQCSLIINATDFDREGELIFYYLMEYLKCNKPFKRAHFSSLTEEGIRDAFSSLKSSKDVRPMIDAGRARSVADWLIGSNMTVAMTLKHNTKGVLSIGRVQTPTLNILVDRERTIKNFKPEKYFSPSPTFSLSPTITYTGTHELKSFPTKEEAQLIMNKVHGKTGSITNVDKKKSTLNPPLLYNLSTLQMAANSKHSITLSKTLSIAQKLYEAGYITYPRTDSQYLPEDMVNTVNRTLDKIENTDEYGKFLKGRKREINKSRYFDDKKVSSHYAIIPTPHTPPPSLSLLEKQIYSLICLSLIAITCPPAKVEKTTITTTVNGENFLSTGTVITEKGWYHVLPPPSHTVLPSLSVSDKVSCTCTVEEKETKPPARYTDKTLISAMIGAGKELSDKELRDVFVNTDTKGIGTEATRAGIVDTLIAREFVRREKKQLIPTEKGMSLIAAIPIDEIKSAELTALWEKRLDKIAKKKDDYENFVRDIEKKVKEWCEAIERERGKIESVGESGKREGFECPLCGGEVGKRGWGWGCNEWKGGCKFSVSGTIAGKKITDAAFKALITKGKTPLIKGFKSKAGKPFDAYLELDENKKAVFLFR